MQAVVVEAELAEGDEPGRRRRDDGGAGLGDEICQVGDDALAPGGVDVLAAVRDGLRRVWVAGGRVLALALALVMVSVMGRAEDGAAARVDACSRENSSGYCVYRGGVVSPQRSRHGRIWETNGTLWRV